MNKGNIFTGLLLAFVLLVAIAGCKDPCKDALVCVNGHCEDGACVCDAGWAGPVCATAACDPPCVNGECSSGSCDCDAGWEGPTCSDLSRVKFLGSYLMDQYDNGALSTYIIQIKVHPSENVKVLFENLYGTASIPYEVYATVEDHDLTIPKQMVGALYSIEGYGNISINWKTASLHYFIRDLAGSVTNTCSSSLEKI